MKENEFLLELEKRADEQKQLMEKFSRKNIVFSLSLWLGEHPWRIILPLSIIMTLVFHSVLGDKYYEKILWIFGGL